MLMVAHDFLSIIYTYRCPSVITNMGVYLITASIVVALLRIVLYMYMMRYGGL